MPPKLDNEPLCPHPDTYHHLRQQGVPDGQIVHAKHFRNNDNSKVFLVSLKIAADLLRSRWDRKVNDVQDADGLDIMADMMAGEIS